MKNAWVYCDTTLQRNLLFEYIRNNKRKECVADDFIAIEFEDGSSNKHIKSPAQSDLDNSSRMVTHSSSVFTYSYQADHIRQKFLRSGIISPTGDHYHILGCSNSQVKKYSFLFKKTRHSTLQENEKFLESIIPDLRGVKEKKGVAKRVKYSGLLFSGVRTFVTMPKETLVQEIADVRSNGFDFADGSGLMSIKLAQVIKKQMKLNEIPSVVQIRFGGKVRMLDGTYQDSLCKGVLLVDPFEVKTCVLSLRPSMLKIKLASSDESREMNWQACMGLKLGVVDWSERKIGKMNQQLICLLSANIPHSELMSIQSLHLESINKCLRDPFSLGYLMAMECWQLYQDLILRIYSSNIKMNRMPVEYLSLCHRATKYCNGSGKLHIELGSSRCLFGAVFPERGAFLKEGQCLVFTEFGLLVDTVVVSRSPSYSPGDIRVLDAVDIPEKYSPLRELRNCILFSTNGLRPEADKMSGGDVDGDQYLVIWDKRLTKHEAKLRKEEPENYDPPPPSKNNQSSKEDWITYVARFDNVILGIVDNAFYTTVKEKGIKSKEAKQLNSLFSSLVDKNVDSLEKLEKLISQNYLPSFCQSSDSTWEIMLQKQNEYLHYDRP